MYLLLKVYTFETSVTLKMSKLLESSVEIKYHRLMTQTNNGFQGTLGTIPFKITYMYMENINENTLYEVQVTVLSILFHIATPGPRTKYTILVKDQWFCTY